MNDPVQQKLDNQRIIWNKYSGGWQKWNDFIKVGMTPLTKKFIEILDLNGDENVLDIASGPGEPGLSISKKLKDGKVTAIDISKNMVEIANKTAAENGIFNFHSQEAVASKIPFGDNSFDDIVCRFGIMFFPDLEKSIEEIVRVLKPRGRFLTAVWAAPEYNPFLAVMGKTIMEKLQLPKPPHDAPGVFRCATPGFTASLLSKSGLADVKELEVDGIMEYDSPEHYWQTSIDLAGPIIEPLKAAAKSDFEEIKSTVFTKAKNFDQNGKLRFPWKAYIATGRKK